MRRLLTVVAALFTAVTALVVTASAAGAHTGFESSDPADGAAVPAGLDTITLRFTGEAEPAGDGFVVLDPDRGRRRPDDVTTPSTGVFVLSFDPPIAPGPVGVRWSVRAPDAHPISGALRFTVEMPDAGRAPPPGPAGAPPHDPLAPRDAAEGLDSFLQAPRTSPTGRVLADAGRFISMAAAMVAVGFLVFSLVVLRGTPGELVLMLHWVRRAGVVLAAGTVLQAAGVVALPASRGLAALADTGAWVDALWGTAGLALACRFAGAAVLAGAARLQMVHAHLAPDVVRRLSAAVPIGAGSATTAEHLHERDLAWHLDRRGLPAVAGAALVLLSHVFDGHTVTEGDRFLTGLASSVHVFAAAVWVGGVLALAVVIRRRARRGEPTRSLSMVTRYSVVATLALTAVSVMGTYLAVVILDAPSELWSTDWGRLLLGKVVVVAVAAAFGAHNHRVLVPALERSDEHPHVVARLRSTLAKEVVVLAAVTLVTALLVRASSTV